MAWMVEVIMKAILIILLLVTTIQDLMLKKISLWIVGMAAIGIGICLPLIGFAGLGARIGGLMVGIAFILLSKITQGKVGIGDGIILCVTGIVLGFWMNLELLAVALFIAAMISIILLIFRLATRKTSIPFVPFIFTAYIILMILQG